jgi:hypothetical protein
MQAYCLSFYKKYCNIIAFGVIFATLLQKDFLKSRSNEQKEIT